MPASRSARAMTFAPRSCPSRPGFAITTRSFRPSAISHQPSNDRNFLILAPHLAQRIAHLTDRRIGANGVEDRRHHVRGGPRRRAERVERSLHTVVVARVAELRKLGELFVGGR